MWYMEGSQMKCRHLSKIKIKQNKTKQNWVGKNSDKEKNLPIIKR